MVSLFQILAQAVGGFLRALHQAVGEITCACSQEGSLHKMPSVVKYAVCLRYSVKIAAGAIVTINGCTGSCVYEKLWPFLTSAYGLQWHRPESRIEYERILQDRETILHHPFDNAALARV